MNTIAKDFFKDMCGKKVAFIGIGTSNLPLIKLLSTRVQR